SGTLHAAIIIHARKKKKPGASRAFLYCVFEWRPHGFPRLTPSRCCDGPHPFTASESASSPRPASAAPHSASLSLINPATDALRRRRRAFVLGQAVSARSWPVAREGSPMFVAVGKR